MPIHVNRAEVTMRLVDGDVLTPQQLQRIVERVIAELRRGDDDERSRRADTRLAGGACDRCSGHDTQEAR